MSRYSKSKLTPAKKKFAHEYARTDNGTQSVLTAFPTNLTIGSARVKAQRLLTNDAVIDEITSQKEQIQQLSNNSLTVFREHMQPQTKPEIRERVAEFVWEQAHGKATQRVESSSTGVMITIDLSSAK